MNNYLQTQKRGKNNQTQFKTPGRTVEGEKKIWTMRQILFVGALSLIGCLGAQQAEGL